MLEEEEKTRKVNGCGIEMLGTRLDSSEKPIAFLIGEIGGGHRRRNRKEIRSANIFCVIHGGKKRSVGGVSNLSRNGAPSRKGCVVNGQGTKASN